MSALPTTLSPRRVVWPAATGALALASASLVTQGAGPRVVLALGACLLVAALAFLAPRHLVIGLMVWLAALGTLRRWFTAAGSVTTTDPLLLIAPFAFLLVAVVATRSRAHAQRSALTTAIGVLCVLFVLGALNPSQGGLSVGVSGLMFLLPPLLAFWIGRDLCDDSLMTRIFKVVGVLAFLAALYGLYQTLFGFPSWDQAWIQSSGYAALIIGSTSRAFASFSSAAEYANYIAIGIVVWVAYWLRSSKFVIALGGTATLAVALFLESSRGVILMLLFAGGVVFAARRRWPLLLSAVAGFGCIFVLVFGLSKVAPSNIGGSSNVAALEQHQIQGLSNPLDPQSSTLLTHLNLVTHGLKTAVTHPVGKGTGVITKAGEKFGGISQLTESDPSNLAVALGLPGLLVYIAVFALGFRTVYAVAVQRRDRLSAVALAIVAVMAFSWLIGGAYAVAPLPWFAMGWADGWLRRRAEQPDDV